MAGRAKTPGAHTKSVGVRASGRDRAKRDGSHRNRADAPQGLSDLPEVLSPSHPPSSAGPSPKGITPSPEPEGIGQAFIPPQVVHGGTLLAQLNAHRAPSVKLAGVDKDGKTIPHHRSEEVAQIVAQLAMLGHGENFICVMVNIRPGQLRKHYYNEMQHSAEMANAVVGNTAFQMANSGEDNTMTKFWLKAKAGWRDGEQGAKDVSLLNIHIHV